VLDERNEKKKSTYDTNCGDKLRAIDERQSFLGHQGDGLKTWQQVTIKNESEN
jgi:hypothetical protein